MDSKTIIRKGYTDGVPVREIAAQLGITPRAVKGRAKHDPECPPHQGLLRRNGIIGEERSLQPKETIMRRDATKAEQLRLEQLLRENGYDPEAHKWGMAWIHLYNEDGKKEATPLVRNPQQAAAEEKAQEEFLARIKRAAPRIRKQPIPSKNLAIPANFDVHVSKLCEWIHTGNQYDIDKAVSQVLSVAEEHQRDFDYHQVSDVLLPLGNDIVHFDNNSRTSTSGTPQDSTSSVETAVMHASEMYIRLIEEYTKKRTVWLCHVHSNHDRVNGWHVSRYVAAWFRNNPRVKWSNAGMSQQHRKYFVFGDSLIMFHHGEAKEEKLMGVIEAEARLAVSQTKRTYVYQGHRHHKETNKRGMSTENIERDYSSMTVVKAGTGAENRLHVEMVRSPSPADTWHSQSLFLNMPAIETYIHDQHGQKHRLTTWL